MSRFARVGGAFFLTALVFWTCGDPQEPETASITGRVTVEGAGVDGVLATLGTGATATSANGGFFRFDQLPLAAYTVTISGFPNEIRFAETTRLVSLAEGAGTANVAFVGAYIRESSLQGRVTAEGDGMEGVLIRHSGPSDGQVETDAEGRFAFGQLRSGEYTLEIARYDSTRYAFPETRATVVLPVSGMRRQDFKGTLIRSSAIEGAVLAEGSPLSDIAVELSGGEQRTSSTDSLGRYFFDQLAPGPYSVAISGFDEELYDFPDASADVRLDPGETIRHDFEGIVVRTASIQGRVRVDQSGLQDAGIRLSGPDTDRRTKTDAQGGYGFDSLRAGVYDLSLEADTARYGFSARSVQLTLRRGETLRQDFSGTSIRPGSVLGSLFIDEDARNGRRDTNEPALATSGVELILERAGAAARRARTDARGSFAFDSVDAGEYELRLNRASLGAVTHAEPAFSEELVERISVSPGRLRTVNVPFRMTRYAVSVQAMMGFDGTPGARMPAPDVFVSAYSRSRMDPSDRIAEPKRTDRLGRARLVFDRADERSESGGEFDGVVFLKATVDDAGPRGLHDDTVRVDLERTAFLTAAPDTIDVLNRRLLVSFTTRTIATPFGGGGLYAHQWPVWVGRGPANQTAVSVSRQSDSATIALSADLDAKSLPDTFWIRLDVDTSDVAVSAEAGSGTAARADGRNLIWVHTGLSPVSEVSVGAMRVSFLKQSLTVGMHRELDEVQGWTTGDRRGGSLTVQLLQRSEQGAWIPARNAAGSAISLSDAGGVVTFEDLDARTSYAVAAQVKNASAQRLLGNPGRVQANDSPAGPLDQGAFGPNGGFSREVFRCPLSRDSSGARDSCSTFAYKNKGGEIRGEVETEERDGIERARVRATLASSLVNFSASASTDEDGDYEITELIEGTYAVEADTRDDDWVFESVVYDEDGNVSDYEYSEHKTDTILVRLDGGRTTFTANFKALYGKHEISGLVGRRALHICAHDEGRLLMDEDSPSCDQTPDTLFEFRVERVVVELSRKGIAVAEERTGRDGRFTFEEIASGEYSLMVRPHADYAFRYQYEVGHGADFAGDSRERADKINGSAPVDASYDDRTELADTLELPGWDYRTNKAEPRRRGTDLRFVGLRANGMVSGTVTRQLGGRYSPARAVPIEIYPCQRTDDVGAKIVCRYAAFDAGVEGDAYGAQSTTSGADGSWSFKGLAEGHYVVIVPPEFLKRHDLSATREETKLIDDSGRNTLLRGVVLIIGDEDKVQFGEIRLEPTGN